MVTSFGPRGVSFESPLQARKSSGDLPEGLEKMGGKVIWGNDGQNGTKREFGNGVQWISQTILWYTLGCTPCPITLIHRDYYVFSKGSL